ncbi:hypothetical protein B0H17DRAFT_1144835 [Mycena rosella]|uniref:Uncharacterized protein n=1 Tax=Mycena rosella TaxID=1033263 RepID=A0AAD7CSB0_MYCRO|nr:hypothetical protein B0H17DRAFT_1144835 [Mycena rosella]
MNGGQLAHSPLPLDGLTAAAGHPIPPVGISLGDGHSLSDLTGAWANISCSSLYQETQRLAAVPAGAAGAAGKAAGAGLGAAIKGVGTSIANGIAGGLGTTIGTTLAGLGLGALADKLFPEDPVAATPRELADELAGRNELPTDLSDVDVNVLLGDFNSVQNDRRALDAIKHIFEREISFDDLD